MHPLLRNRYLQLTLSISFHKFVMQTATHEIEIREKKFYALGDLRKFVYYMQIL